MAATRPEIQPEVRQDRETNGDEAGSNAPGPMRRAKLLWRRINSLSLVQVQRRKFAAIIRNVRNSRALFVTDVVLALLSLLLAYLLRYGIDTVYLRTDLLRTLVIAAPQFLLVCAIVFPLAGLYNRNWRYGSISDLWAILRAVAVTSLVLVSILFFATRLQDIPRSVILVEGLLLTAFLSASRLTFRMDEFRTLGREIAFGKKSKDKTIPILLIGAGGAADLYLRALSREKDSTYVPVGCLDASDLHKGMWLRGVPILGSFDEFGTVIDSLTAQGQAPRHLVFTEPPTSFGPDVCDRLLKAAEQRGIATSRLSHLTQLRNTKEENRYELRSIELSDLLERPQALLDRQAVVQLIRGRRVLVTGAGGSIGSELTLQIAACQPSEIVLIDNCEYNLYAIDLALSERFPAIRRTAHMCNVRRETRVNDIFAVHEPELVFHAAALKHVPMVELNPCEGALTNVIGTMNVADAATRYGALAMVQVSTDKAVNPTSVMGATKRLAELYCQALDLRGFENHNGPRFMTVRFGNVLGSSGSLIPLFKQQIAKGGPLTVTHPEITRFFMTIREAVELTLQSSAYGLEGEIGQGEVFVLDMGEPIKIVDIAHRMIRLAGLVPDVDIAMKYIGLRPGEKLYEELFDMAEERVPSPVPGVLGAVPVPVPLDLLQDSIALLKVHCEAGDEDAAVKVLSDLIPGYVRESRAASNPVGSGGAVLRQRNALGAFARSTSFVRQDKRPVRKGRSSPTGEPGIV
ncbi:polysaccharide biosynthesis protein [Rhizobium sp. TRM95111]|uniref:nucleoside-diphosphate sugar epimerase/dehydratase n=1 Tax=Rhizobium alarense TaxID=2846851 RepID=UPI001F3EB4BC|nr:nucleoside-diphosphate sugar epimerase/dehydratase [Rhizobium alarense]MCF3641824.1 polysaccharide biosynthesis protein [Rhizobium alarense]